MKLLQRVNGMLHSLRVKMLLWAFVFIVPILVILCSSINSAIRSVDEQTRDSIDQLLTPFTTEIDAALTVAKRYIATLNPDLSPLDGGGMDEMAALTAVQALGQRISEDMAVYPQIDAVFFYTGGRLHFIQNYNRSYALNKNAARALEAELSARSLDTPLFQQGYLAFEANGRYYLYIALNVQRGVAGCWFDTQALVDPILRAHPEGLSHVMFSDRNGRMLDAAFHTPSPKQLARRLEPYFVSTRQLSAAPFGINVLWARDVVFAPITQMRHGVFTSISVAILLFALYVVFLRASLIRPLNRLVGSINGIQRGNLGEIALNKNENAEIADVYRALNAMTSQIESLRIQMYEEKLIKQKTQMQLYQLQLRPHFFLNALNTIVSFARIKDYEMVQKMAMHLATHCGYILYSPWYVTVEEELNYTQNFVDMQSAQYDTHYRYQVQAQEQVLDNEIPILAVQIFVENALKYARALDHAIEIAVTIEACIDEGMRCLRIQVDDTGSGLSADTLALLNGAAIPPPTDADRGIGIANIRQRMRILYGESAVIRFSNREGGGAHVEIILPADRREGGTPT